MDVTGAYWPAWQVKQVDDASEEKVPGGQTSHRTAPGPEFLPGGQGLSFVAPIIVIGSKSTAAYPASTSCSKCARSLLDEINHGNALKATWQPGILGSVCVPGKVANRPVRQTSQETYISKVFDGMRRTLRINEGPP